jgi:hypothetical protein
MEIELEDIVWEGVNWINLAQNKEERRTLVPTVMKFQVS